MVFRPKESHAAFFRSRDTSDSPTTFPCDPWPCSSRSAVTASAWRAGIKRISQTSPIHSSVSATANEKKTATITSPNPITLSMAASHFVAGHKREKHGHSQGGLHSFQEV